MMHRTTFLGLSCTLLGISIAQNTNNTISPNNITCSDLSTQLSYNATGSVYIPPLRINGSLDYRDDEYFAVVNDTSLSTLSRQWSIAYRLLQQSPTSDNYTGTIILDTDRSTNLNLIGSCHQTSSPVDTSGKFLWTKSILERSLRDTGNCRATLGDKCVDALKEWYTAQAAENHMRRGNCEKTNNSVPIACRGLFVEPTSRLMNLSRDLSYDFTRRYNTNNSIEILANPALRCNGLNISSTHSIAPFSNLPYEQTVRFPTIDIVTFWPNRTDMTRYATRWIEDVHVEIMCLRPNQIVDGSVVPLSGEELLNRQGVMFPAESGAGRGRVVVGWMMVVVASVLVLL